MKNKARYLILSAIIIVMSSCKGKYFEKHIIFPKGASIEEKIDLSSRLIPSPQQFEWQKMELTAFLHFGINTFYGQEWGNGKEDPTMFYPTHFDAEQWVKNLKETGFKMAILTAKHHDGFCLWPTKTTKHSVAASKWMDGKGDVVKAVKDACDKYGLRFGVYLSPWDRNAESYGTEEYNQFFVDQLTELLTNYGSVYEVWFDGANGEGPNGKKQVYDWQLYLATIKKLQPQAVTAIMGGDVRWVGNEKGLGRETEWSATVLKPNAYEGNINSHLDVNALSKDLGSRSLLENATDLFWFPSEVDVSIRPGWFYHAQEDKKVHSLERLVDIYFKSVGYNSALLLNIPPDNRGLIHENDVQRLKELSQYIKTTFEDNYIIDGNKLWNGNIGDSREYNLKDGSEFNVLMLQEDILKGQRMEEFKIEALSDNGWIEIAKGTTIGYKRMFRFDKIKSNKIRITILQSRNKVNISNVGAFLAPEIEQENTTQILNEISTDKWKLISPNKVENTIFDNNTETSWKSHLSPIIIDLGQVEEIGGFTYTPTLDSDKTGTIYSYKFCISNAGKEWISIIDNGEFSNIKNNPMTQFIRFKTNYKTRYIKLESLREINDKEYISISELGILKPIY